MIFDSAEVRCLLGVLKLLIEGKSKYSVLFKSTKVSHTTLQSVLKEAESKKLVIRHNLGHQNVDYEVTERGRKTLKKLGELKDILK